MSNDHIDEKHDDVKINVRRQHELNYWTNAFVVSEAKLRDAVKKVGPVVRDLKAYFQQQG